MGLRPRILFVDDEPLVLGALRASLRRDRSRWDLLFADSGASALELLRMEPPIHVIVSDLNMPGMSGVELLERCRDQHPETRRLMLTGNANAPSLDRLRAQLDAVLAKPCDVSTLREAIESAIDRVVALRSADPGQVAS